jgi:hypothetical protein
MVREVRLGAQSMRLVTVSKSALIRSPAPAVGVSSAGSWLLRAAPGGERRVSLQ